MNIVYGYPLQNVLEYPCLDINVDIHTCMDETDIQKS